MNSRKNGACVDHVTDISRTDRIEDLLASFAEFAANPGADIVFGFDGGLMALNDRLKLRSMVVGEKDDKVFIASEEAAIRAMEPNAENIYAPAGGEPVIVTVKEVHFNGNRIYISRV